MADTPLVSIILPTYNRAEFIRRAIDSVVKQTYSNWELIVWDDGSTDNTDEVVRSYKNPKIKYIFEKNRGAYYARNRAIQISRGEYIAFQDSDDEWMDGKLSLQVETMIAHPQIDILFSDYVNINLAQKETITNCEQVLGAIKSLDIEQVDEYLFIIKDGLLKTSVVDNHIIPPEVMTRRELFTRRGQFCEEIRNSVDFEFWWRMGLTNACFAYISKVLLVRHKSPDSLSNSSISALENRIKALDLCLQETKRYDRQDLLPFLKRPYQNAWQNMIALHADKGYRKGMIQAFFQSMRYGFNLGSIRLLVEGVWRKKNIDR